MAEKLPEIKGRMHIVQISKFERRWVAVYAILLMCLMSVPYLVGFAAQTPTQRFGGAIIGSEDINSYLAKMNQGAHGAWLFTLPYSSEPQQGAPLYWFYLILGKISGSDFTSRVLAFHLARTFFGFFLVLITYRFLAEFLPKVNQRRLALVIATLGGGLGWLLILFGNATWSSSLNSLPLEFYSPESFSFLMLLILPHLLAARCLLLTALLLFLQKRYIWSGLALLPLGLIQPVTTVIAWSIIGLTSLINLLAEKNFSRENLWKNLRPILIIGLLSAAPILGLETLILTNPILKQWNAQVTAPPPDFLQYLSGFGIYLILAGFGIKHLKKIRPDLWQFTLAWTLLIPIFLYIPIGIQRRLIEGFYIPLTALAVWGLTSTFYTARRWLIPLTLFLVLPSSLLLWAGSIQSTLWVNEPLFQPTAKLAAFNWLDQNAQPGRVVLCAFSTGNVLPTHSLLVPFIGHGVETIFIDVKRPQVATFFQAETDSSMRLHLLTENRINYVVYGPAEQALGSVNLDTLPYLIKRFEQGKYLVYEVIP